MAIESVEGSQFWNRLLLLVTDPARRSALLRGAHAPFLETCPFRVVAWFTLLQLACLVGLWALVTWAGIAGIAFPVFIMLMVPLRMYLLPRWGQGWTSGISQRMPQILKQDIPKPIKERVHHAHGAPAQLSHRREVWWEAR